MKYVWVTEINEFKKIAHKWDELLLNTGDDNPFLTSSFICTWWRHYADKFNLRLKLFLIFDDGKLIGGLPLYQDSQYHMEFIGGWCANYTEFLLSPNYNFRTIFPLFIKGITLLDKWRSVKLLRYRRHRIGQLDTEDLDNFKKSDIFLDIALSGYNYLIEIPNNIEEHLRHLPKKLRYYIRRSQVEILKLGHLEFCQLGNWDEIEPTIELFFDLSRRSFKNRNRVSVFEDETNCAFLTELIQKFYVSGYLIAHILKLNNRPIAVHFGYTLANNINYVFPTFDINFAKYSPGHLLIYKLLEFGVHQKSKIFDLYSGYQLYKEQWCSTKEEILTVQLRPRNLSTTFERKVEFLLRHSSLSKNLKNIIESSSPVYATIKKGKDVINKVLRWQV